MVMLYLDVGKQKGMATLPVGLMAMPTCSPDTQEAEVGAPGQSQLHHKDINKENSSLKNLHTSIIPLTLRLP